MNSAGFAPCRSPRCWSCSRPPSRAGTTSWWSKRPTASARPRGSRTCLWSPPWPRRPLGESSEALCFALRSFAPSLLLSVSPLFLHFSSSLLSARGVPLQRPWRFQSASANRPCLAAARLHLICLGPAAAEWEPPPELLPHATWRLFGPGAAVRTSVCVPRVFSVCAACVLRVCCGCCVWPRGGGIGVDCVHHGVVLPCSFVRVISSILRTSSVPVLFDSRSRLIADRRRRSALLSARSTTSRCGRRRRAVQTKDQKSAMRRIIFYSLVSSITDR